LTGVVETFRTLLVEWLEGSRLFPEKDLHIDLMFNPMAGALRHRRQTLVLIAELMKAKAAATIERPLQRRLSVSLWTLDAVTPGNAFLAPLRTANAETERLVVVAGGDGTSRSVLISALSLEREARERLLFFRLPLGTGNDAAETRDWATALSVLSGRGAEFRGQTLPVLQVTVRGQTTHFSFNIASVGLDAFVVDLTNRMKSWFPGNSYSLMVDLAAFFYEFFVRVVPTTLRLSQGGVTVLDWHDKILLAAMGTSGYRTYGAGKKVLPDQDNFCLAGKKNLFSKLAYRRPFYEGLHRGLDGIVLASGDALRVESEVRLPLQMDGEVLWLEPSDFPLTMAIADQGLRILSPQARARPPQT